MHLDELWNARYYRKYVSADECELSTRKDMYYSRRTGIYRRCIFIDGINKFEKDTNLYNICTITDYLKLNSEKKTIEI